MSGSGFQYYWNSYLLTNNRLSVCDTCKTMANATVQTDLTTCSICFEKFRTPKLLPCSHVFCQSCISSYIVSSCESKEAPVGFSCPICREFVPSPTVFGEPEQWAEDLPVCNILSKMVNIGELCLPCERENEKEKASKMCLTCEEPICETCAKFHKRILTTKNHHIVPLNEPGKALQFVASLNINESCPHHSDKKAELHCIYHQQPCCSLCVGTEHGQCVGMETMQSAAEKIKKEELVKVLRGKIDRFQQDLLTSKKKQEKNITQIDCESDRIKDGLQKLRKEIIDHLDELENKHINELSHITKKSKDILNKNIDSVSDRIHFSGHCIQSLQNLEKSSDMSDVCFVKEYHRVRKSFEVLEWRTSNLKEHEMNLNSTILNKTHEITKMACLTTISCLEHLQKDMIHFLYNPKLSLALVYEFEVVPHDDVYDGVIHSNGTITLAKYGNSSRGLQQYTLEAGSYQQTKEYCSIHCFFGLVFNGNVYYATNRNKNYVVVISRETFTYLGTIPISKNFIPYGICLWNEFLFVACQTAILKYNIDGRFVREYPVDFNTLYVMVTSPGEIVYTNSKLNFVASVNQRGKQLWKYRHAKLRSPHGIDKDEMDNLYVGSTGMNSVHILSCGGSLIRIVEDVPKPVYIRVQTSSRTCFVCSNFRKIKVYKMILQ